MRNFKELAENTTIPELKEIYEIIAKDAPDRTIPHYVGDSGPDLPPISHSLETISLIKDSLQRLDKRDRSDFIEVQDFTKNVAKQAFQFAQTSVQVAKKKDGSQTVDSFFNSVTGVGTSSDPGFYNTADIPIYISPNQATAYYSSGGIPKVIIDKKVMGPFINGYKFTGDFSKKQLDDFKMHYHRLGFERACKEGLRDSLLFGGSAIIPHFEFDSVSYGSDVRSYTKDLKAMGPMGKKQITRFWTADRWNLVLMPNTDIAASDYFYPPYFYCPIAGLEINTQRMAIIRINQLPFWGAIVQAGWGVSDLESWMKSVLSYNIMISAIPIMAQQISLVYTHIPADPLIFQNGPDMFEAWAENNNRNLELWSVTTPKTFNSYGEIKTLERTYAGYEELVRLLRENIGAESTIPESSIFHTQSKGFSDNLEDVTLKQSEAFKQISNIFVDQIRPLIYTMGLDFFGFKNEEKVRTLALCLDSNTVLTNDQKASMGMNFFNMLQVGMSAGLPVSEVATVARKFISGVEIDDSDIKLLESAQDEADKKEKDAQKTQAKSSGLFGMGGAKKPTSQVGARTPAKSSLTPGSKNDQKSMVRKASGKGSKN